MNVFGDEYQAGIDDTHISIPLYFNSNMSKKLYTSSERSVSVYLLFAMMVAVSGYINRLKTLPGWTPR